MFSFCLVRLIPKDMRSQQSINLGVEIVANIFRNRGWEVDVITTSDTIEKQYDIIGFNIFYITHQLNLVPFLKRNNIECFSEKRIGPLLIAGGQGVFNPKPIEKFIDLFVIGEGENAIHKIIDAYEKKSLNTLPQVEGVYYPKYQNDYKIAHVNQVTSETVIFEKMAMVELNRGCKHRCKFCQYGHTFGKYREKDFELVKHQIDEILSQDIKNINLLSCNLGGYSKISELLDFCIDRKVRLMNSDFRVDEYINIASKLEALKVRTLKVGIESFDEATRFSINKKFTDKLLYEFIECALDHNVSNLHFYLIYGLPGDNYQKWFDFLDYITKRIKSVDRPIRCEYSFTNFEPALYTPMENAPVIDFEEKEKFLRAWLKHQEKTGIIKDASKMWYGNMSGRLGRKHNPYWITMWLTHCRKDISHILYELKISGISRSIKDPTYKKIRKLVEKYEGSN